MAEREARARLRLDLLDLVLTVTTTGASSLVAWCHPKNKTDKLAMQRNVPEIFIKGVWVSSIFNPKTTNWDDAVEVSLFDKSFLIITEESLLFP